MTFLTRVLGATAKLPPAETYDVIVERDLKVPMLNGVVLLADRYAPRGRERLPTILVRCCYGRRGFFGLIYGRLFAERGYQVVMQSTRGTFGSGGVFEPFVVEHDDGLATVAWLKQQPWFSGAFATNGASYLGFVQWAIASDAGPELKAMAIQVSTAEFRSQTYTGGSYALDTIMSWTHMMANQERRLGTLRTGLTANRTLKPVFMHLPLRDLDKLADGEHAAFYQTWLEHTEPGDAYWRSQDFSATVKDVTVPINMIGGWYDIFLPWMLRDYASLRAAGQRPYLTIGPWAHATPALMFESIRQSLAWFRAYLYGDRSQLRKSAVRVFVTGANEWRDLADWPPPGRRHERWHLQPDGGLAAEIPPASAPDHYRYDPANPTPSVSGPLLAGNSLPTDNRKLEARPDVLTYTSAPLEQDLDVIGPVQVELFARSSLEHTDFFTRLCDVDEHGTSLNVCDALLRVEPGQQPTTTDGCLRLTIDLWPTAHRFRRGHRVRLQVSSGAHPRYARNTGSGEPLASATKLVVADQSIYHDPKHPSSVELAIV
ncbi:MAG TPA: CocE/NonD family hydrolase [Ktedonobacteraceae bacterium]|nr:CocE/NonD family hydrolase [Ktedonobacteraceae bacterium]